MSGMVGCALPDDVPHLSFGFSAGKYFPSSRVTALRRAMMCSFEGATVWFGIRFRLTLVKSGLLLRTAKWKEGCDWGRIWRFPIPRLKNGWRGLLQHGPGLYGGGEWNGCIRVSGRGLSIGRNRWLSPRLFTIFRTVWIVDDGLMASSLLGNASNRGAICRGSKDYVIHNFLIYTIS